MALKAKSLFLYGLEVSDLNRSLDFRTSLGGPELMASLTTGFYTLSGLATEIKKQLEATDTLNTYSVSINRNVSGGLENRVTISTTGSYLSLLFNSGSRAASTCCSLIGFHQNDKTGAVTYVGDLSAGNALIPSSAGNLKGYGCNYIPPQLMKKVSGTLNIAASGRKESVVWSVQRFFQVQFKYILEANALSEWSNLLTYLSLQREVEFTPEVTSPNTFYVATLESSDADGKGLGFTMREMLPNYLGLYDTGLMKFRVKE